MDQDGEATELLGQIITTVHWLLIQHLPVAKQTTPYIVHIFFTVCCFWQKKNTPHLSHSAVKLVEIAYHSSGVKQLYVIFRQMSSVCLKFESHLLWKELTTLSTAL